MIQTMSRGPKKWTWEEIKAMEGLDAPQDGLGWTRLHWASFIGPLDLVEFLIKEGCNVNSLNIYDQTPLDVVGPADARRVLVAAGAKSGVDL